MGKKGERHRERIRSKIQESIERAEDERKRELFRRRIELARNGVVKYKGRNFPEAVRAFHTYLRILEEFKGVGDGGLRPSLFDKKNDLPELLLISGVYWDLSKLYDRTRSPERQREFRQYLEKYVTFSKGLPYQSIAAETLRRYLSSDKAIHKTAFKDAYKALGGSKCFIASALVDLVHEETIPNLQRFRDTRLKQSVMGRLFIWTYYKVGPIAAEWTEICPDGIRRVFARILDRVARLL